MTPAKRGLYLIALLAASSELRFSAAASIILTEKPLSRTNAAVNAAQSGGSIAASVEASSPYIFSCL
jgi:hypothetical protein